MSVLGGGLMGGEKAECVLSGFEYSIRGAEDLSELERGAVTQMNCRLQSGEFYST